MNVLERQYNLLYIHQRMQPNITHLCFHFLLTKLVWSVLKLFLGKPSENLSIVYCLKSDIVLYICKFSVFGCN